MLLKVYPAMAFNFDDLNPEQPLPFPAGTLDIGARITVRFVDMFGYCGRDNHPEKTDRSRTGTILARETFPDTDEDDQPRTAVLYGVVLDTSGEFNDVRDFMDFEIAPAT